MLIGFIASVLFTGRVKEKALDCTQNELKFYWHLPLHVITPVWLEKTDAAYCFRSFCTSNLYFNLKVKFIFVQHRKIS